MSRPLTPSKSEGSGEVTSPAGGWGGSPERQQTRRGSPSANTVPLGSDGSCGQGQPRSPSSATQSSGDHKIASVPSQEDAADGCGRPLERRTVGAADAGSREAASHGTACPCAISLPPTQNPSPSKPTAVLALWPDGSRADIPGVRHLNPTATTDPPPSPPKSKRGKVTGFSEKSRRNFLRQLCTLVRSEIPHTMALTLPAAWEQFDLPFLQQAFKKLGERFDAKCLRDPKWAGIALAWKKEPQKRGALHWHLLFYGIDNPELEREVQRWFADQWNALICSGLDPEERRKHAVWHHHEKNWEPVEAVSYFTKYVGKVVEADATGSTGRWWGFWRKPKLPWAAKVEGTIPDKVAVDLNRIARKIRQNRADEANHAAACRMAGLDRSPFQPSVLKPRPPTLWDFQRLRQGIGPDGKRDSSTPIWRAYLEERMRSVGIRPGKYRFKMKAGAPHPDELKITLTGNHVPDLIRRAAEWSASRHGIRVAETNAGSPRPRLP